MSSTLRNQSGIVCRQVARARSSTCYITISATTTETGDPMAFPCNCEVLRETFERKRPPGDPHSVLTTSPVKVTSTSLQKKRVLYLAQWGKLVSPTVSSRDFDITLLVVLLRNVCGLSPPATSLTSPPTPTDVSETADIVPIRIHRKCTLIPTKLLLMMPHSITIG